MTRETVATETPAALATSLIVALRVDVSLLRRPSIVLEYTVRRGRCIGNVYGIVEQIFSHFSDNYA